MCLCHQLLYVLTQTFPCVCSSAWERKTKGEKAVRCRGKVQQSVSARARKPTTEQFSCRVWCIFNLVMCLCVVKCLYPSFCPSFAYKETKETETKLHFICLTIYIAVHYTLTFCLRRVQFDVGSTFISLRNNERKPLLKKQGRQYDVVF